MITIQTTTIKTRRRRRRTTTTIKTTTIVVVVVVVVLIVVVVIVVVPAVVVLIVVVHRNPEVAHVDPSVLNYTQQGLIAGANYGFKAQSIETIKHSIITSDLNNDKE